MKSKRTHMKTMTRLVIAAAMAATHAVSANDEAPPAVHFTEFGGPIAPQGITLGPDGALWFTHYWQGVGGVGRITTAGAITDYSVPMKDGSQIVAGPDGALWFTETDRIGRITTAGVYTDYPVPSPYGTYGITAGPDHAVWFAEVGNDPLGNCYVGRINPAGIITQYLLPAALVYSLNITRGPGRTLWYTTAPVSKIGSISAQGAGSQFPGNCYVGITGGADGALWCTDACGANIWRVAPDGNSTPYPLPDSGSFPNTITRGSDHALWFNEIGTNRIGRITTAGIITEYTIPTPNSQPEGVTAGPDRAIWFTEHAGSKIGRLGP
jgi:virginiamycin B lyase